jgi:hypothetical protein
MNSGFESLPSTSDASQVCYSLADASKKLRELVEGATQSVWVATAFIDRCGVDLLKKTGARGVQVKVLTSVEVDEGIVKELTKFAEVRVVREKFMHAKMYIVDGKALIGSANLTCPVLEGKNIEILCEVPLEQAVKSFNALWNTASALSMEKLLLRIKDAGNRVVIESQLGQGLHLEIDKLLKRPVIRQGDKVVVCPSVVTSIKIAIPNDELFGILGLYERKVSETLSNINSYPANPCAWMPLYTITIRDPEPFLISSTDYSSIASILNIFRKDLSPAAFIFVGLYSIVKNMYMQSLANEFIQKLNEALNQLDAEFINFIKICKVRFEPSLEIWLKLIDGIEVEIEYAIILRYVYGCDERFRQREPKMLEMAMTKIQEIVRNVFNELKTRFEAVVKQLYENYRAELQKYGEKIIDIDGTLKTSLSIYIKPLNPFIKHEVVLGPP